MHRTAPLVNFFGKLNIAFNYGFGNKIIDNNSEVCVLTSGPQLINFCGAALDKLKKKNKISADLFAVSTLKNLDIKFVNEITDKYKKIFFIEELIDCAGLFDEFMK
ncbi:MAG TPA: transketolase C-terminal domain-containing protein, partial [bacterium]|nr:transketolase C-terminal domain-containing protein [bacterium]